MKSCEVDEFYLLISPKLIFVFYLRHLTVVILFLIQAARSRVAQMAPFLSHIIWHHLERAAANAAHLEKYSQQTRNLWQDLVVEIPSITHTPMLVVICVLSEESMPGSITSVSFSSPLQ